MQIQIEINDQAYTHRYFFGEINTATVIVVRGDDVIDGYDSSATHDPANSEKVTI